MYSHDSYDHYRRLELERPRRGGYASELPEYEASQRWLSMLSFPWLWFAAPSWLLESIKHTHFRG